MLSTRRSQRNVKIGTLTAAMILAHATPLSQAIHYGMSTRNISPIPYSDNPIVQKVGSYALKKGETWGKKKLEEVKHESEDKGRFADKMLRHLDAYHEIAIGGY